MALYSTHTLFGGLVPLDWLHQQQNSILTRSATPSFLSVFTMQSDQLNKNNGLYLRYQTVNFTTMYFASHDHLQYRPIYT